MLVQLLEIDGTLDQLCQDGAVGQVRRVAAQVLEIREGHVVLHVLPPFRAAVGELVGMKADDLQRVLALRRARGISDGRADYEQRRLVDRNGTASDVPADAQEPSGTWPDRAAGIRRILLPGHRAHAALARENTAP